MNYDDIKSHSSFGLRESVNPEGGPKRTSVVRDLDYERKFDLGIRNSSVTGKISSSFECLLMRL